MKFKDLESILIHTFSIPASGQKAFKAKLNNMRRPDIGCIPGIKHGGKGQKINYNRSNLRHLFLAIKLNQLGLDPKFIGKGFASGKFPVDDYFDLAEQDLPKFKTLDEIRKFQSNRNRNEKFRKLEGKESEIDQDRFEKRKAILVMLFLHEEDSDPTFPNRSDVKIFTKQGTSQEMMENLEACNNSRFSPLKNESAIILNFTEMAINLKTGYLRFKEAVFAWEDF